MIQIIKLNVPDFNENQVVKCLVCGEVVDDRNDGFYACPNGCPYSDGCPGTTECEERYVARR